MTNHPPDGGERDNHPPDGGEVGCVLEAYGHIVRVLLRHTEQVPPEVNPAPFNLQC